MAETAETLSRRALASDLTCDLSRYRGSAARSRFTRETWRPVPGWGGYEASCRGRVRSVDRFLPNGQPCGGLILTPQRDRDGYEYVTLCHGGRRQRIGVHRLVLLAHRGQCPAGMEGLHGNGCRWDNRLANLRWGTKPENRADREQHRRDRTGTGGLNGKRMRADGFETGVASCALTGVTAFPRTEWLAWAA